RARPHGHLHSFPPRRSSDLLERGPRSGRGRVDVVPVRERLNAAPPKLIELLVARTDRLTQPLAAAPHLSARRLPLRHRSPQAARDRKSTRLNSSHVKISYAV